MSTPTIKSVMGSNPRVQLSKPMPPVQEYQDWLDEQLKLHPTTNNRTQKRNGSTLRRIATMKRNGSSFIEISEAIGWGKQGGGVRLAYMKLPDHLK